MQYDWNKLIEIDGDELLRAMKFPFDEKEDLKTVNQWIIDSGMYYYLCHKKYAVLMPNIPVSNLTLSRIMYKTYDKAFKAMEEQLKDSICFKSECPEEGEFYGYKFVILDLDYKNKSTFDIGIVKLRIPEEAKRVSPYFTSIKCRCDMAFVEEIKRIRVQRDTCIIDCCSSGITHCNMTYYKTDDGDFVYTNMGYSYYDSKFKYIVGNKPIIVRNFDEDRWHECTNGIHFFMTPEEAVTFARFIC